MTERIWQEYDGFMPVRVLSFHRTYACRDSGVCCSSAWPIPVERDRLIALREALAGGRLTPAVGAGDRALLAVPGAPDEAPAVLGVADTRCVFFDLDHERHCRVQQALGHAALPLACRQFPRVTVQTPLGTSVSLSHYCPTAAALLRADERVSIVTGASAFPEEGEYVGLDVRESLPPLLCPDVLMDWPSWETWEEHSVDLLCNVAATPAEALGRLRAAVERLRQWRPGPMPLDRAIADAFDAATRPVPADRADRASRVAEVLASVPDEMRRNIPKPGNDSAVRGSCGVEQRFLAAHAFASWTAYQGHGLRSWLRGIEAASALLEMGYSVAGADLLLRHLADTQALTRAWNQAEL